MRAGVSAPNCNGQEAEVVHLKLQLLPPQPATSKGAIQSAPVEDAHIRRLGVGMEVQWGEVLNLLSRMYSQAIGIQTKGEGQWGIRAEYNDTDGDTVAISSQDDWRECLRQLLGAPAGEDKGEGQAEGNPLMGWIAKKKGKTIGVSPLHPLRLRIVPAQATGYGYGPSHPLPLPPGYQKPTPVPEENGKVPPFVPRLNVEAITGFKDAIKRKLTETVGTPNTTPAPAYPPQHPPPSAPSAPPAPTPRALHPHCEGELVLRAMGFSDYGVNIEALEVCGGEVDQAMDYILAKSCTSSR